MVYLITLLVISFAVSAFGWIYFIYFFSIGYGFAISALSVTIAILFHDVIKLPEILFLIVLFVYGVRLGLFLLFREKHSSSYKKILYPSGNPERKPVLMMLVIWISCALLYVGQVSPITFYLYNLCAGIAVSDCWVWVGLVMSALGVFVEIVADVQKSAAKKKNDRRFVDTGLYRIVRCPNYFGELLLWTGSFIICMGACCTFGQWIIAVLGYLGIVYVMFSGARRLEIRQAEIYGDNQDFKTYIKSTPLIIPLIPIYSVAKYTWLKG